LSCRAKLEKFECLKYWGRMVEETVEWEAVDRGGEII